MEGCSKKGTTTSPPQLLDLIPTKERAWLERSSSSTEEKKLELRLAPPGDDWPHDQREGTNDVYKERGESLLCLGYVSSSAEKNPAVWFSQQQQQQQQGKAPSFIHALSQMLPPTMSKESSQPRCCTKVVPDSQKNISAEKKAFSLPPTPPVPNTAVSNTSQKRTAPGPVVGWPPIRSFRKNLTSTSSLKPSLETQNGNPNKKVASENPAETARKGLFVKINMDGVPIGRKVDLQAYESYEELSTAVDELFTGLLAAQRDTCAGGIKNKQEEEKAIAGVLCGSGEYTLVYEDNEGDRMLVGDVPWHAFICSVKRLRVLKSSSLSRLDSASKTRAVFNQGRIFAGDMEYPSLK